MMKKKMRNVAVVLTAGAVTALASDSLLKPLNDLGVGTFKLRAQTISMARDYEGVGNGYSTTLGWKLDYLTPEWEGLSAGVSFIHADVLHTAGGLYGKDGEGLLFNGRVNELNELWMKYSLNSLNLTNTFVKAGRQVINGEVFRADEFRQKQKAVESILLTTKDIPNTTLTIGHAIRFSNAWDSDSNGKRFSWRYHDIEEVLGATYRTDGVSWIEAVNTSISNVELAVYNAYAHDIVNMVGGRIKYTLSEKTALNGYYRNETDVGKGAGHSTDMVGASIQYKTGGVTLEPGVLSIAGDTPYFSEFGTGINHPLGSSMMIYSGIWTGGADSYYLKATTKINKTALYALYNYTTHDALSYEGQELNFVATQPITDRLTVSLKTGIGYRDGKAGGEDTTATDARLFVTYNF